MQSIREWGAGVVTLAPSAAIGLQHALSNHRFSFLTLQTRHVSSYSFIALLHSLTITFLITYFFAIQYVIARPFASLLLPASRLYLTSTFGSFSKCRSGVNLTNRFRFPLFCQPIGKRKTRAATVVLSEMEFRGQPHTYAHSHAMSYHACPTKHGREWAYA